jgi:hypothetical protein
MSFVSRGVGERDQERGRSRGDRFRLLSRPRCRGEGAVTASVLKPYTVVVYCPFNRSTKCWEDYYTEHVCARNAEAAGEEARRQAFEARTGTERVCFLAVAIFEGHLCEAE